MAALTITATSVKRTVGGSSTTAHGIAGETLAPGDAVYLKASDSRYWLAQADGTEEQANASAIVLAGSAASQSVFLFTGGTIDIGATVVVGTPYFLHTTAGKIGLHSDLTTGHYASQIGKALEAGKLEVTFDVYDVVIP